MNREKFAIKDCKTGKLCGRIALLFPIPEPAVKPAHRSTNL